ncbi:3-hydroxybutyrate dehydrogenase [Citricoccus sp. I39-566]|uniref:3-hydroxybutyrate dehydrogenase n=1 Tax=Citricoccus sp. I39-566 TaxID=3073268 RepID=UPI00286C2BEE|nr:3-hydroxybutyrate dehydrogenase [Citricoccus sp. I39-566]WMY76945.1 3-hydroxybutyrate dehydrogenase [Citricoccus sp. I39-566]
MTDAPTQQDRPQHGASIFREGLLVGRRAVVTGGASGIGAACVRALAAAGATVTVADLNAETAEALAAEVGGTAWVADLADTEALEDLELDTDILVNNAGIQRVAPVHEFDPKAWRFIHRLMLESPFLLTRAALPGMYERGFGRIINLSSAHGLRASAFKSAYVSAKHGLEGLSKVTALEGGPHGVTSNCINPGYVKTALVEQQIADQASTHGISEGEVLEKIMLTHSAIKRLTEPEEVAALVVWLATDAAGMTTGASYTMDGGWTAQ